MEKLYLLLWLTILDWTQLSDVHKTSISTNGSIGF